MMEDLRKAARANDRAMGKSTGVKDQQSQEVLSIAHDYINDTRTYASFGTTASAPALAQARINADSTITSNNRNSTSNSTSTSAMNSFQYKSNASLKSRVVELEAELAR